MTQTNSELKSSARNSLMGQFGSVILAGLFVRALALICGEIFSFYMGSVFAIVISLVTVLLLATAFTLLNAGLRYMYLQIARARTVRFADAVHCFMVNANESIRLSFALCALNTALALPFAALRLVFPAVFSRIALRGLLAAAYIAAAFILNTAYSMSFFIHFDDPALPAREVMKKSRRLTRGYRLRLTGLLLSFAGYMLLCIVTLGIGFLWVYPYIGTSAAHFYLALKETAQDSEFSSAAAEGMSA